MLHTLLRDIRATLRSLAKEPGFTFTAVVTTGLGIGATTLIFSVVYGVLLKPLPYRDPGRLVSVWNHLVEERQFLPAVHAGDFRDYQAMSETFQEFAAATVPVVVGLEGVLTGDGPPLSVDLLPVTHNFFSLLGVDPVLGRHFTVEEEAFNGPRVAILSHEFWSSRYGSDESILGRSIQIDGQGFSVVGVLPRDFRLLLPDEVLQIRHSEIWVPLQREYSRLPPRNWTEHMVLGRLRPDVTLAQAQAEMDRIAEELRAIHPAHANSGMQIHLVPLQQDVVKNARSALLLLLGAVGFVLLIACANVAHLLLCRSTARSKELAIRTALGASRGAVVQRVFIESLTIGILGSGFGLLMTHLGLSVISAIQPPNLPRVTELGVSGAVWAFAAAAALVTAGACGLVPVYQASRTEVSNLLRDGSRAGRSAGATRARNAFVIGEMAFSLALLVGAGLMFRSFQALSDVQPGFQPEGALTFGVSLPRTDYSAGESVLTFYDELRTRLGGLPGVEAVGGVSQLPLTGQPGLWAYAYDEETAEDFNLSADGLIATEGYFQAMGTEVVAGRGFTSEDQLQSARVEIVDEMLANRAWPDRNPVGQQLQMRLGQTQFALTVVGVVRHMRIYDLTQDVREHLYLPHGQFPARTMNMVVRGTGDPLSLASAAQDEVWALDGNLPLDELRPLESYFRADMAQTRFTLMLMTVFGALALTLAVIGVYGVNSYIVGQRAHEFGIRLALGENPTGLVRFVMLGGARIVLAGVGIGLLASFVLARSMRGLLFEVSTVDAWTYATLAGVLTGAALLACYVPSRRTAKADPVTTLKAE